MPEEKVVERARRDAEEGKSPSTQAGEFVREEFDHIREGKHGDKFSAASHRDWIVEGAASGRQTACSEEGEHLAEKAPSGSARRGERARQWKTRRKIEQALACGDECIKKRRAKLGLAPQYFQAGAAQRAAARVRCATCRSPQGGKNPAWIEVELAGPKHLPGWGASAAAQQPSALFVSNLPIPNSTPKSRVAAQMKLRRRQRTGQWERRNVWIGRW